MSHYTVKLPNYLDTRHPLYGSEVMRTLESAASGMVMTSKEFVSRSRDQFPNDQVVAQIRATYQAHPVRPMLSGQEFAEKLEERCPIFKDFDWSNLVLAGKSVREILRPVGPHNEPTIWDLYYYSLPDDDLETANIRLKTLVNRLLLKEKERGFKVLSLVKTSKHMSLEFLHSGATVERFVIRVHFILFQTLSDCLRAMVVPSCQIGFDGLNLWLNSYSAYAYRKSVNILDPSNLVLPDQDTNIIRRFGEELEAGFSCYLPDLRSLPETTEELVGPCYYTDFLNLDHNNRVHLRVNPETRRAFPDPREPLEVSYGFEGNLEYVPRSQLCHLLQQEFDRDKLIMFKRSEARSILANYQLLMFSQNNRNFGSWSLRQWVALYGTQALLEYLEYEKVPETIRSSTEWLNSQLENLENYYQFLTQNLFEINWINACDPLSWTAPFKESEFFGELHWTRDLGTRDLDEPQDLFLENEPTSGEDEEKCSSEFESLPPTPTATSSNVYETINTFLGFPN